MDKPLGDFFLSGFFCNRKSYITLFLNQNCKKTYSIYCHNQLIHYICINETDKEKHL